MPLLAASSGQARLQMAEEEESNGSSNGVFIEDVASRPIKMLLAGGAQHTGDALSSCGEQVAPPCTRALDHTVGVEARSGRQRCTRVLCRTVR